MPDVNQYTFKHRELLELMIKSSGVREGRWRLIVNFGFTAGHFGATDETLFPGAVTMVNYLGIQQVLPGTESPAVLTMDAAEVNPAPT